MCDISAFTFKSLIHLKLIFVFNVRSELTLLCRYIIFLASCVKKMILSPLNFLDTIVKNQLTITIRIYFSQFACIFICILMLVLSSD